MPTYVPGYFTPFVCPCCQHAWHGDNACKIRDDEGACSCDG